MMSAFIKKYRDVGAKKKGIGSMSYQLSTLLFFKDGVCSTQMKNAKGGGGWGGVIII